jgi:hypothetical protein
VMIAQGLVRKWDEAEGDSRYCVVACALTENEHQQKVN